GDVPSGKDPNTGKNLLSREGFWEEKKSIYALVEDFRDFCFGRGVERAKAFGSNLVDHWYDALSYSRHYIAQKGGPCRGPGDTTGLREGTGRIREGLQLLRQNSQLRRARQTFQGPGAME